ncbi:MAG: 50S ribosomal protein L29 [Anaerolineales bacterium]|nr:50S ribosomal protein L29 [Anaerolineales bacterium]
MSKANDIRKLTTEEIQEAIDAAKEAMMKLRFQKELGQLEDTTRIQALRRDIARYKTVLRETELAQEQLKASEE